MEWLNYHHLLYFYTVAKEGSVARASQVLHLAQPTLSGQIRKLEHALGEKLFEKKGRHLVLTEMGRVAYRYADEIFAIGRELTDTLRGRPPSRAPRFQVGIADVVPKLVVQRLLAAARLAERGMQLVLREGKGSELSAALAAQEFDLVISDAPLSPQLKVRAFNHLLGESTVTFFASPALARRHPGRFPKLLDGAPVLLPTENTALRRSLDDWLRELDLRPRIVAEIEDSALLDVFGQRGAGIFPAPTIVAADVRRRYGVRAVGVARKLTERFYAITVERRITHPGTAAITEAARTTLFP
jgi:LysR family transcriptional activator of nhaA